MIGIAVSDGEPRVAGTGLSVAAVVHACHEKSIDVGLSDLAVAGLDRSALEQTVLLWLAILREPVSLEELLAVLVTPLSRAQVLEAVEALRRRSLLERGKRQGTFTLQAVVLEYATGRLIAEASREIKA